MPRPEPGLTRRGLMQASAALACGLSMRAEAAALSRPDVVLTVGRHGTGEGFRFANYRDRFPFWSPGWADVLAGRTVGSGVLPALETLLGAFAIAGYAIAFPSPIADVVATPRFLVAANGVGLARSAILIVLPASHAPAGDGLIVRMPGVTAAGGSCDVPMNPLDIAPTICGLAGVPKSRTFTGRDYSALVPVGSG